LLFDYDTDEYLNDDINVHKSGNLYLQDSTLILVYKTKKLKNSHLFLVSINQTKGTSLLRLDNYNLHFPNIKGLNEKRLIKNIEDRIWLVLRDTEFRDKVLRSLKRVIK